MASPFFSLLLLLPLVQPPDRNEEFREFIEDLTGQETTEKPQQEDKPDIEVPVPPVPGSEPETDPEPAVEDPEPPAAPTYSQGQLQLLGITQARNSRLSPHPRLMYQAQRLASYHARTGRWGHSSRSWRGNASENIAWNGNRSISQLGRQWTSSRGHNSNWLGSWSYVGVGVAFSGSRVYGVQLFSNSANPGGSNAEPYLGGGGRTVASRGYRRVRLFGRFRRRR